MRHELKDIPAVRESMVKRLLKGVLERHVNVGGMLHVSGGSGQDPAQGGLPGWKFLGRL